MYEKIIKYQIIFAFLFITGWVLCMGSQLLLTRQQSVAAIHCKYGTGWAKPSPGFSLLSACLSAVYPFSATKSYELQQLTKKAGIEQETIDAAEIRKVLEYH